MSQNSIKMLVTIVPRGKGGAVVERFRKGDSFGIHYVAPGFGTVNSEVLEYLGLGEAEKDVVFSILSATRGRQLMEEARAGFGLHLSGRGILFLLPITAATKLVVRSVQAGENTADNGTKEELTVSQQKSYSLITAFVNRGYTDMVMEAAKAVGARGGTVIHAKSEASEERDNFLGIQLQQERELILILVPQKDKAKVMQAISSAAGMHTKAHGIMVALPVEDFDGIS